MKFSMRLLIKNTIKPVFELEIKHKLNSNGKSNSKANKASNPIESLQLLDGDRPLFATNVHVQPSGWGRLVSRQLINSGSETFLASVPGVFVDNASPSSGHEDG